MEREREIEGDTGLETGETVWEKRDVCVRNGEIDRCSKLVLEKDEKERGKRVENLKKIMSL